MANLADRGPTPKWDMPGTAAFERPPSKAGPAVREGQLNRVVWMCWTGSNPMPSHLRLCVRTVERNSGLPVVVVTPRNLLQYVPDPHPGYQYLHLAHRADYLRCCLLHRYGGLYLDTDTICLRGLDTLFDELAWADAVGYDGSQWGELVGISDMGPFRPLTDLTQLWFNVLHAKMHQRLPDMQRAGADAFYWQEILRDIFVPASLMYRERISTALKAYNPDQADLWSTKPLDVLTGSASEMARAHVLILNNAKYGELLEGLDEEQILGGPSVLSQLLRSALGPGAKSAA